MNTKQRAYNAVSVIVIILLVLFLFKTCEKKDNAEKILEQSKDTLKTFRDKQGLQHAQISVLQGSISDLKKLNSKNDSTLKKLQDLVDKNTTMATILDTKTTDKGSSKTKVTFPSHTIVFHNNNEQIDSIKIGDVAEPCDTVYPTYSTKIDDKWTKGTIVATKDSIFRNIKFFNEFTIKEELVRDHFWQEKHSIIEVVSKNPNTETIGLRTFSVKPKKVRRVFIFVGGIVAGSIGTYLIINSAGLLIKK